MKITSEQLEEAIRDLAFEAGTEYLLTIPGVWEAISEHFNNEAIEVCTDDADTDETCESCNGTGTDDSLDEVYEGNCLECNGEGTIES